MRRKFLFLIAIGLLAAGPVQISSQTYDRISDKRVKPVKGTKLIVSGAVRDGEEVLYRFKARAGQTLAVKLVGRDADFSLALNHGLDVESIKEDVTSWTGKFPAEFDGECEIAVHSKYKLASYRLEILLR